MLALTTPHLVLLSEQDFPLEALGLSILGRPDMVGADLGEDLQAITLGEAVEGVVTDDMEDTVPVIIAMTLPNQIGKAKQKTPMSTITTWARTPLTQ